MALFTDQLGRTIELPHTPQRIISLVPSQTELLYHLGLEEEVVGITKFCVHPEHWFRTRARIGSTKQIRKDLVRALRPDCIIANKEENVREQVEELAMDYPVWVSDIHTLDDALDMMRCIGELTGRPAEALSLTKRIEQGFNALHSSLAGHLPFRTAYLIWKSPFMTVGHDTFIHDMLRRCGLYNVFGHSTRYPEISLEELQSAHCDLLLLSSEPYPFSQKHIDELRPLLPQTRVLPADGEMFSWYGSRLLQAPEYFSGLLEKLK